MRTARFPDDEPLDPAGLGRADGAASAFDRRGQFLCDDTLRTRQTCNALGVSASSDPLLADLDIGTWRGRSLQDVPPDDLETWLHDPDAAPHGGESVLDLLQRVGAWLAQRATEPGRITAVTHPAVVRAALVHILACPPSMFWRIDVPPLSATRLNGLRGTWTLRLACHRLDPSAVR